MNIATLAAQHDALSAIAGELLAQVNGSATPCPVAALRWRLARALLAHLAIEDSHLYPQMLESAEPTARTVARAFRDEMGDLATRFTRYMFDWPDMRVAAEWGGFRDETRAILAALAGRIARENERLYPLAPAAWLEPARKAG
jgi:hypothetical protein